MYTSVHEAIHSLSREVISLADSLRNSRILLEEGRSVELMRFVIARDLSRYNNKVQELLKMKRMKSDLESIIGR